MNKTQILIVDDENNILNMLERVLKHDGYSVLTASSGDLALNLIDRYAVDIVLTDIKMPGMDGMELLTKIKEKDPYIKVLLMTAFATLDTAIEALKAGASDYIRKPFNIDEVLESVRKTQLILNHSDSDSSGIKPAESILIANSPPMKNLIHMVHKVASSLATVYIHGETGAGKELVARAIHEASPRREKPFVKVNCSALPETLLESELFGHEKGAFTGANAQKLGRFEIANGGTIFLDEIGDISPLIQLKLLRIIQQKEFERLGSTETIPLDIRIITATNKDLETLVAEGLFREDLYYRLNVIPLTVPPLRQRQEDLKELIEVFIDLSSQGQRKALSNDALQALLNYDWPGNVRELENIIERIIVISDGNLITTQDLPEKILASSSIKHMPLTEQVEDTEERILRSALIDSGGNVTKAAQSLGISRRSLHRKINKFNIDL
ncbi:sigma-54-dependent transcriptional regulator [Fusibacter sp. JL216-2]|uniref:sigma-54-dependent transcriptional regulator n=1 Tax=Fusibacter sp. JL216-2 TaxID=3071453 RepID=UPI003D33D855